MQSFAILLSLINAANVSNNCIRARRRLLNNPLLKKKYLLSYCCSFRLRDALNGDGIENISHARETKWQRQKLATANVA